MADDDGIILNLAPYEYKPNKPKEKTQYQNNTSYEKKKINNENGNKNEEVEKKKGNKGPGSQKKSEKASNNSNKTGKRKYIDPKDFVPISNIFNKNPDIPEVSSDVIKDNPTQVLFSSDCIDDLNIGEKMKSNLKDHSNYTSLTKIQKLSLPLLISGKDVMIRSPTGSGKTLCYAIPIVDRLSKMSPVVTREDGPYALVVVPTRELALQTLEVFQALCKCCISIVPGMLIGGEKCKAEKARLRKGVNILIATPGRLVYHMKETTCLDLSHIQFFVLDEGDHLLDMGFRGTILEIMEIIEKQSQIERQSVLLSATLNSNVQDLISVSLKDPVFINSEEEQNGKIEVCSNVVKESSDIVVKSDQDYSTPSSLNQFFIIVPAKLRLVTLMAFILSKTKAQNKAKIIIFTSSKNSVVFLSNIFKLLVEKLNPFSDFERFALHGDMNQQERFKSFDKFKRCVSGVLCCTDVASRGLDIKKIDWVVHYDVPTQTHDYLHRTGRTARIGESGNSLIFLMPSEAKYVEVLSKSSITLSELKLAEVLKYFSEGRKNNRRYEENAQKMQTDIEETISESKETSDQAIGAFKSFIQGYATYPKSMKDIFHVKLLHLGHIAKSFGLRKAPVEAVGSIPRAKKRKQKENFRENVKRVKVDELGEVMCGPRTKKLMNEMKKKKKRPKPMR